MFILDEQSHLFCLHAVAAKAAALQTARQTIGDALCACGLWPERGQQDVFKD